MKNFVSTVRRNPWAASVTALAMLAGSAQVVHADAIPYPTVGTPNPVTYTFTAAASGDVMAYFAASTASYDNQLGMLDNGVLTSAGYGLDNHSSSLGQSFDLGHVSAGDTLVFVLHNVSPLGINAYSNPSMNGSYDLNGSVGHNHVYSTAYTGTGPIISPLIPVGTFVSFEDLQFPSSDFNYNDEDFVFTDVATTTNSVPDSASSLSLLGMSLAGIGLLRRRLCL